MPRQMYMSAADDKAADYFRLSLRLSSASLSAPADTLITPCLPPLATLFRALRVVDAAFAIDICRDITARVYDNSRHASRRADDMFI